MISLLHAHPEVCVPYGGARPAPDHERCDHHALICRVRLEKILNVSDVGAASAGRAEMGASTPAGPAPRKRARAVL